MTSGAEAFKAALRRSALLIGVLVVLGAVALVVIRQVQGPRYSASSRVLISTQNLGQVVTGTQPSFVDPQRILGTAQALAESPELYSRVAQAASGKLGDASSLRADVSVSTSQDNILTFTASASSPDRAINIANAAAVAYIPWRRHVLGQSLEQAVAQIQSALTAQPPPTSANATELRKQLETLRLMQTLNNDATVVDRATSADKTRPRPVRDALLGASIGLVVALLIVALREAIDTTVRSESDVEQILGAPVLASIRTLPRRTRMVTYGRHETAFGDTYALLAATLAQAAGDGSHVYAITSALSGEGKTTTAANLGVALARRGHRVIVADFDFRKPKMGEIFRVPENSLGTLNVLDGTVSPARAIWQITLDGNKPEAHPVETSRNGMALGDGKAVRPGTGSLWVVPAGGALRNQSELDFERLSALLDEMRQRADFVLVDTPPALLTVEMAELGNVIDAVLIVVRQGHVTHRSLRSLQRQAARWQAEITGAVVTDTTSDVSYGYYGGR